MRTCQKRYMKKILFLSVFFIFYLLFPVFTGTSFNFVFADNAIRVEKIADNKYEVIVADAKLFSDRQIRYDGKGKSFFVKVGDGEQQLKVTPKKAVEVAYISGMMNEFEQDGEYKKVNLIEKDGKLMYEVRGKKAGKILGIWGVSYDTKAQVDGEGKLVNFEKPWILKITKYLIK